MLISIKGWVIHQFQPLYEKMQLRLSDGTSEDIIYEYFAKPYATNSLHFSITHIYQGSVYTAISEISLF